MGERLVTTFIERDHQLAYHNYLEERGVGTTEKANRPWDPPLTIGLSDNCWLQLPFLFSAEAH